MVKCITLIVLIGLACLVGGEENSFKSIKNEYQQEKLPARWDDQGLTANVNDYVDHTLSMVIPFMQENGLDPMPLPDISEGFEAKPVWVTYHGQLELTQGRMTGLVNLARSGDQKVQYHSKTLRIRIQLEVKDLEFQFRYRAKLMNIGPVGDLRGTLSRLTIAIDLLIDFNTDQLSLQNFSFEEFGSLRLRLSDNSITDWLLNPILSLVASIFNNNLFRVIETNVQSALHSGLTSINSIILEVLGRLDAMSF